MKLNPFTGKWKFKNLNRKWDSYGEFGIVFVNYTLIMAIPVVEFSREGYKNRKVLAKNPL